MPSPDKIEVFHKILREAAHADVPVHEIPSYSQITEEDINAFEEIQKIWELSKNYTIQDHSFDKDKAFNTFLNNIKNEISTPPRNIIISEPNQIPEAKVRKLSFTSASFLKYAAVIVALLVATYFFIPRPETISSGQSGLYVTLLDGSSVWLDKNSSITLHKFSENNRKVEIQGRAYFDITKNDKAPFSISTPEFDVTVLGTSFVVDQYSAEVDVLTGIVKVSTSKNTLTLYKNEKVSLKNTVLQKTTSSGLLPSWANPELSFDNTPLDKVVADLSAFYQTEIVLEQKMDWSLCPFTSGSLAKTSLEDVFTLLALTYECKTVKNTDTRYTITAVNCQ